MAGANWSPAARADLDDIAFHIGVRDRRREVAERIYREIPERTIENFEKHVPGHRHPLAPPDWLYWRYKRWLLLVVGD